MWIGAGLAAFALARLIGSGPRTRPLAEFLLALAVAMILGLAATALDFGGWREPDWRAGLFVLAGAFAAVGMLRFTIVYRSQP